MFCKLYHSLEKQYGNKNVNKASEIWVYIYWFHKDTLECFLSKYSYKEKGIFLKDAYNEAHFMFYFISSFIPSCSWNKHSFDFLLKTNSREEMATHSSILAWRSPRTEKPGRLQSMGLQRLCHDWATKTGIYMVRISPSWIILFSSPPHMNKKLVWGVTGFNAAYL